MKTLPVILIVTVILLGVFTVYRYTEAMTPIWQQSAQVALEIKQAVAPIDIQAHQKRVELFTGILQGIGTVLLLLVASGGAVLVWKQYDQRKESWARAVDGTFALQHFNQSGQLWVIDPNKSIFGVIGQDRRTGQITTDAGIVGPDRQLTYATSVQTTRTAATVTGGDGFRYAATGKYLAGAYDRPRQLNYQIAAEPMQLSAWQPLTLADAFARSTADNWLLGNGESGACSFNVFDVCHTGLIGATKTGKTSSTALLMAMNARKHGMHVVALDGAGGIDWSPYSGLFEVHATDYATVGDQLDSIVNLHNARMKALKLAGVASLEELDYEMPSLFVVLEEYGRLMQSYATANNRQYKITESALSNLMRVSRKTGIYFLLIDQSLNGWSPVIKANIKDYFCYHLGGNQAAAFNFYEGHKL